MPYNPYIFVQNSTFPYINAINKNELVKKLKCGILCVHVPSEKVRYVSVRRKTFNS